MTTISKEQMIAYRAELFRAARWAVMDLLDGSVEWYVGPGSTLQQQAWCSRCLELTLARMALASYGEYVKQLSRGRLSCDCGGKLQGTKPLIVTDLTHLTE